MSNPFVLIAGFCFGLCVGSFLNVCICRLPGKDSVVSPGSRCPRCKTPIRFYDNIPVLSYIWLAGKCRFCNEPISLRYPLVELLSGGFAVCSVMKFGLHYFTLIYFIFIAVLLVITFIDLDHQIIPDIITLPGIPIFFAGALLLPQIHYIDSIIGIIAGGGSLYAVTVGYYLITGSEGMGGGDIKLLAMIGAVIGWQGVILTIFAASVTGTLIGGTIMLVSGKNLKLAVPFGPFLAFGAIIYVFFGQSLIHWYLYGIKPF
ncbi:MAG: prepilin peptidase [Thermodesulfobacteriota bacterium]